MYSNCMINLSYSALIDASPFILYFNFVTLHFENMYGENWSYIFRINKYKTLGLKVVSEKGFYSKGIQQLPNVPCSTDQEFLLSGSLFWFLNQTYLAVTSCSFLRGQCHGLCDSPLTASLSITFFLHTDNIHLGKKHVQCKKIRYTFCWPQTISVSEVLNVSGFYNVFLDISASLFLTIFTTNTILQIVLVVEEKCNAWSDEPDFNLVSYWDWCRPQW